MRYSGATAVITGAGSGIGRALAVELASRGSALALSDVDEAGLAETVERCAGAGALVRGYRLDVSDREAVLSHAGTVASDFGRVDLVINNAGVAVVATVAEMSWADFDWLMGVNFWGVVHGTKAFLPHLLASGDGHLVNISSVFGFIGVPSQSAYNSAKFAVRGFTEALRQEMVAERKPVVVSCVHPGGVRTNIVRNSRISGAGSAGRDKLVADFARLARTTPEQAAATILRGVERGRARILVGPDAYAIDAVARVLGSGYEGLLARFSRRAGTGSTG
ncbi:MAG: SDR family NAD(P)-dependent oxidoreductase [Acidimicrobiales bacterium]